MIKAIQVGNILAFLMVLFFNYFANTGAINGETMASVSARYANLFTPASYAFSIWGVIYIALGGFIGYQATGLFNGAKAPKAVAQVGWWFIISCVANVLWIFSWLNQFPGLSVGIMGILLFSLIMIILRTRMELDDEPLSVIAFVWWPFSFYAGWISIALIANAAAYLTAISWNGFGISEVTWTVIMILIAGALNLLITWTRNMREFALVGVWGLVAVAIANWEQHSSIAYTALIVAGILFISSSVHGYKNREYSPWKKL